MTNTAQEAAVVLAELRNKFRLLRSTVEDVERRLLKDDVHPALLLASVRALGGDVLQVLELAGEYKGLTGGTHDPFPNDTPWPPKPKPTP